MSIRGGPDTMSSSNGHDNSIGPMSTVPLTAADGDPNHAPSPSKSRSQGGSSVRHKFMTCALFFAVVGGVYLGVDYFTSERIEEEITADNADVSHSAHNWGAGVKRGTIKSVSVLGERNSGTTWVYEHLGECFNHTIPIRRRLTRYKHWFQHQTDREDRQYEGSLVLAQFRNIFEWTRAMQATPHHAPAHMDIKDWRKFVTKNWTMARIGKDLEMSEDDMMGKNGPPCQEDFYYKDVITCNQRPYPDGYWNEKHKHRFSEHQPFYEMRNDGSGEPYANLLDMRTAKIHNFLETKNFPWVKDVWVLRYESLLKEGTLRLIQSIEKVTGVKANCTASPPQNRKKREIDKGLRKWLEDETHVDWKAEKLIGYAKE